MTTATFVTGKMEEFIANIDFSLNLDGKKSVKVKIGDLVYYDGLNTKYTKQPSGEEILGTSKSLKSAISNNWLTLNVPGVVVGPINVKTDRVREDVVYKQPDYNPLKGGSFDEFVKKDKDTYVAGSKVIREDDHIVKATEFSSTSATPKNTSSRKMEIAGDQVDVKNISTTVSNSTSTVELRSKRGSIIQADDGQAAHVIVGKKKEAPVETPKKKNTFTVDSSTPRLPDDATINDVVKATASFDGSQDSRVIKKIGEKGKMPPEPSEVEGIVLKKTDFSKKSSGSTPVADLSGVKTQGEVNAIEAEIGKREASPQQSQEKNYIEMLPDDWGTLHWVKKEQFVMAITDVEFLKFIMKVESVKAIQSACKKRMAQLEKPSSNG